ncbi:oxidoreductase [Bradyrhizobium japonicum]|uniref:Oxidoreductase n=1 Tax=Bradyrhizobium japonicum TaxID=375 RepID=A0A1L3FNT4_BRAJP|nr:oxidoreductase [Bradyrhizobium japonicum]
MDETRNTIGDENNTGALLDKPPARIEPLSYVRGLCRLALAVELGLHWERRHRPQRCRFALEEWRGNGI